MIIKLATNKGLGRRDFSLLAIYIVRYASFILVTWSAATLTHCHAPRIRLSNNGVLLSASSVMDSSHRSVLSEISSAAI